MVAVDFERIREFSLGLVLKRLLNITPIGFHSWLSAIGFETGQGNTFFKDVMNCSFYLRVKIGWTVFGINTTKNNIRIILNYIPIFTSYIWMTNAEPLNRFLNHFFPKNQKKWHPNWHLTKIGTKNSKIDGKTSWNIFTRPFLSNIMLSKYIDKQAIFV